MSAQKTPVTELDFFALKKQFKDFLKTQDQFKDFNYEGSNISVLLDVLAYNTYQNNFYNNMVVSEMFLDSALKDTSAVSHAKSLNYLPKSRRSSRALLSFDISVSGGPNFFTIPRHTKFIARKEDNTTFSFYTDKAHTVIPNDSGVYRANCIPVYEGKYVKETYKAVNDIDKKYQLSNEDVDISSIRVHVTDQQTLEKTEYIYTPNIFGIELDSKVFYLQNSYDKYELYFGRGVFGMQPSVGDTIEIEYRTTSGADGNGVVKFALANLIDGNSISNIKIDGPSSGGTERESKNSIKFFAPKSIQVQERAVTESDYAILIKNKFPEVRAISVIGGEQLTPPKYGKVGIFIDAEQGSALSNDLKNRIETYLVEKMPLGIRPLLMNPNFIFVEVNSSIFLDTTTSTLNNAAIQSKVKNAILAFSKDNLENFGKTVRASKLSNAIDSADANILSNQTNLRVFKELAPSITRANNYEIDFNNALTPIADYALRSLQSQIPSHPIIPKLDAELVDRYPTVSSSQFRFKNSTCYIRDDGYGALQIIRSASERDIILVRDVGEVDYKTGKVIIRNFSLDSYRGVFKLYANTKYSDINVSKGDIIKIRETDLNLTVKADAAV